MSFSEIKIHRLLYYREKMKHPDILCVLFVILSPAIVICENDTENVQLQDYILQNYNPDVRPVLDRDNPHHIQTQLFLISLDDFDMKKQTVKCRMIIELKWRDEFLTWNPAHFENTTRITIDSESIWVPDLLLGNEEGPFTFLNYSMIGQAIIEDDGAVTVWPYIVMEVGCQIQITDYPFDEQSFYIRMSSWSLTTRDVIMGLATYNMSYTYYQESGQWAIKEYYAERWNKTVGPDKYSRVAYFLTVQRKSLYFILNVIGPLVVTSLLNTMCFILPVESAQRVTLSVSIFLSLAIFLTIVAETQPRTSNGVSVTVIYLCFQICGSFLTIAMNVVILNIYHRNESKKKSLFLQSMLQMSKNMAANWTNDPIKANGTEHTNETSKRASNGHAILLDNDVTPKADDDPNNAGTSSASLQLPQGQMSRPNSIARRSVYEESRKSSTAPEESDTKRKVPLIKSRSVKEEETVWTTRAKYLNICSFWFSVVWNIGLVLVIVIIPRV